MNNNRIVKNYIYNMLYQVVVVLYPVITTPYISRVLGATNIGIFSYVQSITTYFVLIGALGSSLYGQREIAYVQDDPDKRTLVFKEIVSFRFLTVFVGVVAYGLLFCREGVYQQVFLILLIEVVASAFDISWFFMGIQDFRKSVLRNIIIKLLGIVLVFTLVKSEGDVNLYAVCYAVPILISNLSLWLYLPGFLTGAKRKTLLTTKHFLPLLALFVPQIATEVYTVLDKTMLGLLSSGMNEVGFYEQSQKIIKVIVRIITALGLVMLPKISKDFMDRDFATIRKSLAQSFRFVFFLGAPLMFGIAAIAYRFVPWFYGSGYDKIVPLMIVIAPIILFIGVSNVLGKQYLLPTQQQRAYTISILCGSGTNVVFNFLLIPFLGSIGAAFGTVIAEFSVMAVQIYFVRKSLPLKDYFLCGVRYLLLGAGMCLIVLLTGMVVPSSIPGTLVQVGCGMVIYLGALLVLRDEMMLTGIRMVTAKFRRRK